jgi:uncharacterized protein (TIGR03546 family)
MFWLNYLQKLVKALHDNTSPSELAGGFVIGAMIGLLPKFNLTALALWCVLILLRVNIGFGLLATVLFSIVGSITDPLVEKLGFFLLTDVPALTGLWTLLYNTPIIPFSAFNDTLVMGNFVFGLLLAGPLFLLVRKGIVSYRVAFKEKIMKWRVVQALTATKVFDLYLRWINR